jgi:prolyl-tRNA synthetase
MKDLYTFDHSKEGAMRTYESVRSAYAAILGELHLPYLVAEADSGNMGGKLSHEYHYISAHGEDTVYQCGSCNYTANEEVVEKPMTPRKPEMAKETKVTTWKGVTLDRKTVVYAHLPQRQQDSNEAALTAAALDMRLIKELIPNLDASVDYLTASLHVASSPTKAIHLVDYRLDKLATDAAVTENRDGFALEHTALRTHPESNAPLDLLKPHTGSQCPRCENGTLTEHRCIEVGHTFHLGTRYSEPMNALVASPSPSGQQQVHIQMGCHGIGVSRLLAATAAMMADVSGLRWPRRIAPFEAVVIPAPGAEDDAVRVYDKISASLGLDTLLDDRDKPLSWKLKDADLIGYPLVLVLGQAWKAGGSIEVQCRNVPELGIFVGEDGLLDACDTMLKKLQQ